MLAVVIIRGCCDGRLMGLERRRLHFTAQPGAVRYRPAHPGVSQGGADRI